MPCYVLNLKWCKDLRMVPNQNMCVTTIYAWSSNVIHYNQLGLPVIVQSTLTVAKKCLAMNSYTLHSVSLNWSLEAFFIGVIGGWSPISVPPLQRNQHNERLKLHLVWRTAFSPTIKHYNYLAGKYSNDRLFQSLVTLHLPPSLPTHHLYWYMSFTWVV